MSPRRRDRPESDQTSAGAPGPGAAPGAAGLDGGGAAALDGHGRAAGGRGPRGARLRSFPFGPRGLRLRRRGPRGRLAPRGAPGPLPGLLPRETGPRAAAAGGRGRRPLAAAAARAALLRGPAELILPCAYPLRLTPRAGPRRCSGSPWAGPRWPSGSRTCARAVSEAAQLRSSAAEPPRRAASGAFAPRRAPRGGDATRRPGAGARAACCIARERCASE